MARGPRYRIGARSTPAYPFQRGRGFAPTRHLPGATGARTAAIKRAQGAPTPEPIPDPTPEAKCIADYVVKTSMLAWRFRGGRWKTLEIGVGRASAT